ncbi:MAG: hypothetical protein AAGG02_20445 [Cyanobacteria bacterium P01_H01_bin.15]
MLRLNAILPGLSILFLVLSYLAFGWYLCQILPNQVGALTTMAQYFQLSVSERVLHIGTLALGAGGVVTFAMLVTKVPLLRFLLQTWFKSDMRTVLSVLIAAFAVVLIFVWLDFFMRLAMILGASILARLEFQGAGYNWWQTFGLLIFFSSLGISSGIVSYTIVHT